MADSGKSANKPIIQYRVELQKRIQINKSFSERRNQAVAMRILSYGLFGQKRYQNLYLTCSLNCFHLALKIANQIHQRVAGLAMIIKFDTVQVLQYFAQPFNGKYFQEKKYSKITIKLTKNPTEQDKKEAGYIPGLQSDQVQEPLTEVLARKKRGPKSRYQNRNQQSSYNNKNQPQKTQQRQEPKKKYRESTSENVKSKKDKNDKKLKYAEKSTVNTSRRQDSYQQKPKKNNQKEQRYVDKDKNRGSRQPKRNRYEDDDD